MFFKEVAVGRTSGRDRESWKLTAIRLVCSNDVDVVVVEEVEVDADDVDEGEVVTLSDSLDCSRMDLYTIC